MLCLCRPPIVSKMRSKSVISNNIVLDISLPKSIECIEGELAFPQGLGLAGMNISRSLEPIKLDYIRDIKGETVIRYRIGRAMTITGKRLSLYSY